MATLTTIITNLDNTHDDQTTAVSRQSFPALDYTASYVDLMQAFGTNTAASFYHYINYGLREGRTVSFDGLDYIASYDDLMIAYGTNDDAGSSHYIMNGWSEGRTVTFDGLQYLASYPDLIKMFGGPSLHDARSGDDLGAVHYINSGHNESRVMDSFNAEQYLYNYADLQAAFGNDLDAATLHYIRYGYFEGRVDEPVEFPSLVSRNIAGVQGNGFSEYPSFSSDGRYVVFQSYATNLVPGDTNNYSDIFVKDLLSGAIQRVSTDANGGQAYGPSYDGVFSADGHHVVFTSYSSNLVPGDTNYGSDVFVKDLQNGTIQCVSTDANGGQGNDYSWSGGGQFSADGRHVVFVSAADNLVPSDTNEWEDVFVKDLLSGAIQRVSTDANGGQGDLASFDGQFSVDGRYVLFASAATNLVPGDTSNGTDVFVKDLQDGTIQCVSTDANGGQGDWSSVDGQFSADGHYVLFQSYATNLVPIDTNNFSDIFVKDLLSGAIQRVSTDANGGQANGASYDGAFSADGRYVLFTSLASNLVPGDINKNYDIFVKDLKDGAIHRVSVDANGGEGNGWSSAGAFSADGRYVLFASDASNLVPGDTNGSTDVFVALNPFVQTKSGTVVLHIDSPAGVALGALESNDLSHPAQSIIILGVPDVAASDLNIV